MLGSVHICGKRYLFSGDKQYLAEVYPLMKGAAEFFQDFLVKDP